MLSCSKKPCIEKHMSHNEYREFFAFLPVTILTFLDIRFSNRAKQLKHIIDLIMGYHEIVETPPGPQNDQKVGLRQLGPPNLK